MTLNRVIVYKGKDSQTGTATRKRYPSLSFEGKDEDFEKIINITKSEPALGVLPIWNSHVGKITLRETHLFKNLFDQDIRFEDIWPEKIEFQVLARKNTPKELKPIISVGVARIQCSDFLKKNKINCDDKKEFIPMDSTVDAYKAFLENDKIMAILRVPSEFNGDEVREITSDAANPYNFTTFALFGGQNHNYRGGNKWKVLEAIVSPKDNNLIGIEMPIPDPILSDEQSTLLDEIFNQASHVDLLPKVIFVFNKSESECGVLLEISKKYALPSTASDSGSSTNIFIKQNLGETKGQYREAIFNLLELKFSKVLNEDFVKHLGERTCFFACPTLNIMTHGFNEEIVESVVRTIIFKYFQLIDGNMPCTAKQMAFFKKYERKYRDMGDRFVNFYKL